jgi:hypothetical protein
VTPGVDPRGRCRRGREVLERQLEDIWDQRAVPAAEREPDGDAVADEDRGDDRVAGESLARVRSKRAATRMNGAARTRRLSMRIEATSPAEGCSVGCGGVAGASPGTATARTALSAVAAASAAQQKQIVRRSTL